MTEKEREELEFQKLWVEDFKKAKGKVRYYWQRYRYLDTILEKCKIDDWSTILDIGSGISSVLHFLPGTKIALDPLMEDYQNLYDFPDSWILLNLKAEDLNAEAHEELFDVVFCSNALDHTESPEKAMENIYRILKPGGYFVLTVQVFLEEGKRNEAHPHSLTYFRIFELLLATAIFNPSLSGSLPYPFDILLRIS